MKVLIEMHIPSDVDLSALLERMQEIAVELHEEYSDNGDDEHVVLDAEKIADAVSVWESPTNARASGAV